MNESIASGSGRGKNKRFWTREEDNALITALSDLNADPHWKCHSGFKNGYMVRLEEVISKTLPGCGLKALPHIDSRLKTLVTKFRAIVQMLNTDGFKWDDEKHMISVQRSVYDEYCKAHPNCKNLYGHDFPHFNALMEIYGKDYAIRKPEPAPEAERVVEAEAERFVDTIDNMEKSPAPTPAERFVDVIDNMEKSATMQVMIDLSDDEDTIVSGDGNQIVESAPPLKKVKRETTSEHEGSEHEGSKRQCESDTNSELASLQAFMKAMNVHLSTMAKVMSRADKREQEVFEKSEKVLDVLLALEGVTPQQALEVAQILTAQPNKLMLFFKCSDDLKCIFVKSLLA